MMTPERERELEKAIDEAVTMADRRIMDAAGGDNDILDFLTATIAIKFMEKVGISLRAQGLMKIDTALARKDV